MARPHNQAPSVEWAITLPVDLASRIESRLRDPTTGKVAYGARARLIQALLLQWLASQPKPNTP